MVNFIFIPSGGGGGGGGGGTPTAVETRTTDSSIITADNGKVLFVPTGFTVILTIASGLPQGFEFTVIADADAEVTIVPASGQQLANGSQPPIYGSVDESVVSPKIAQGATDQIGSGKWKLVGTQWAPLGVVGWTQQSGVIVSLEWRDDDQITVINSINLPLGGGVKSVFLYTSTGDPVDLSYTPDDRVLNRVDIQGVIMDTTGGGIAPDGQPGFAPPQPTALDDPAKITDIQGFSALLTGEVQITPSAADAGSVLVSAFSNPDDLPTTLEVNVSAP